MDRRGFLQSILAAGVAPAFVGASILMPVRKIWTPPEPIWNGFAYGRYVIIGNAGHTVVTIDAMEHGGVKHPTPHPIHVHPGNGLVYDLETRVFTSYEPSITQVNLNTISNALDR